MTEITSPIPRLLTTHSLLAILPSTQINPNLQIFLLQNPRRNILIDSLRLSIHKQLQFRLAIQISSRNEGDGSPFWHDGAGRDALRVSCRAENTAPIRVFAVQCGFDERGARDCACDGETGGIIGTIADGDRDEFGGAFAVADDEV